MPALAKRILSGLTLGALFVLLLFRLPSACSIAALIALSTVGLLEFYQIQNHAGVPAFRVLGSVTGAGLIVAIYLSTTAFLFLPLAAAVPFTGDEMQGAALFIIVFVFCIRQFPQKKNPQPLPTIACTIFGIMYVPFLMSYLLLLAFSWEPVALLDPMGRTARITILYLIIVVKVSDIGAFITGKLIGRHKMFPRISPGKTWEGLAGGLGAGLLASLIFYHLLPKPDAAHAAFGSLALTRADAWVLGLLLAGVGVVGDLVESLMKRAAGLKDSGLLVPGMGGVLDVVDSILFATPVLYYYARWIVMPR